MARRSSDILDVPFHTQLDDGYCLPACVQMVLDYLGLSVTQGRLARQIELREPLGAPASNVTRLRSDELDVVFASGTLDDLRSHLARGDPPIAFVQAHELPHWRGCISQHAVVVVGIADQTTHILDPAGEAGPTPVLTGDFVLAWIEMDALYAIIRRVNTRSAGMR